LSIADDVFVKDKTGDEVVNIAVVDGVNYAYLTNDIVSFADSGGNSITEDQSAVIRTGDAYSVISLLNKVNTTIVDSQVYLITINIFGNVEGDIFLPELGANAESECCGDAVSLSNQAIVENTATSSAMSGKNQINLVEAPESSENALIETGSSQSTVNIVNVVNQTWVDAVFHYLVVNNLGIWLGDFLGWDNFAAQQGGQSLLLEDGGQSGQSQSSSQCGDSCFGDVSLENSARVTNNLSSGANSGSNSISAAQGQIKTGNAYSTISLINFVNTTILDSKGFFGFINIFGSLRGHIGGASLFQPNEPEPEPESQEQKEQFQEEESGTQAQEEGGKLEVSQSNNVGAYVLPGDTVTFFIKVRNKLLKAKVVRLPFYKG
jgi:hypothetical protein